MLGRLSRWLSREQPSRSRLLDSHPVLCDEGSLWQPEPKKSLVRRMLDQLGHRSGLSSLSSTISTSFQWVAENNLTGAVYNPITNTGSISKSYSVATTSGNTVSGGGDEVFSFQQSIAAGATADIDLKAMTNLLSQTSISLARIKGVQLRLLSATDDSTISPAPTATSTMTVTNNGPANPTPWTFQNGGSGATVDLTVVANAVTAVASNQGGTGYPNSLGFLATPQVSNTVAAGCVFFATANSGGVITSCTFISNQGGTSYGASNLPNTPLVPVGQQNIYTGGAGMYFDVSAAGFLLVSTDSRNLRIINMDQTHAITAEIDVIGATS